MRQNSTRSALSLTLCLTLTLVCLSRHAVNAQSDAPDQRETMAAYNAAIYDAAVYKFSNLRPLRPLAFDSASRSVTVVRLTRDAYTKGETTLQRDIWVTQAPEVQERCRDFTGDVALRLRQLLGLHPGDQFTSFVTMTVKEGDIFRPTANPDPMTTLPCSCPVTANCGEAFPDGVSEAHVRWLANQMLRSYVLSESPLIPKGYPWTRLGYTYDWRPGSNKYGASEYIVRKNSKVTVTDITPYRLYCTPPTVSSVVKSTLLPLSSRP